MMKDLKARKLHRMIRLKVWKLHRMIRLKVRGFDSRHIFSGAGKEVRRLILAWLSAAGVQYLLLSEEDRRLETLNGLAKINVVSFFVILLAVFFCFSFIELKVGRSTQKLERMCLFMAAAVLSVTALCASFTMPFFCGIAAVMAITGIYAVKGWDCGGAGTGRKGKAENDCKRNINKRSVSRALLFCFTFLFFVFVSVWTVCRVKTFSSPTYDFGIFSQMFYGMKTTGIPYTTLERDGLLSHFNVHVSPIYYLMLPFYCICPEPATLQILQALVLASAVVPLWKITRLHHFTEMTGSFICLLLLVYPAYAAGAGYDLHENAFLTPLILWLLYGIDSENGKITALFAGLTFMVKEDAAVYVAVTGVWLVVRAVVQRGNRERDGHLQTGVAITLVSVAWFLIVTWYLGKFGDGVMTYRYSNLMYDGSSSLLTVIKAAVLSPVKVLYECMDKEKVSFIALTLLSLGLLPLATRKYERYILMIPYVLVNLMPDYRYQHDIFFQYTYGSAAFLIYLTVVNMEDIMFKTRKKHFLVRYMPVCMALSASCLCFGAVVVPEAVHYPVMYVRHRENYEAVSTLLKQVPPDAAVAATTFYTVPLSGRPVLYDVRYAKKAHLLDTEYIVLGLSDESVFAAYATDQNKSNGCENFIRFIEAHGYIKADALEDTLAIYCKEKCLLKILAANR